MYVVFVARVYVGELALLLKAVLSVRLSVRPSVCLSIALVIHA